MVKLVIMLLEMSEEVWVEGSSFEIDALRAERT